ncbi:MAG: phosphatidate cytidylyltransferase [Ignavibacteriaceae bacterium]
MPVSENLKRIIVSIVAIPVILVVTYLGGYYFLALVVIISLMSFYEFSLIVRNKNAYVNLLVGEIIILLFLLNQFKTFVDTNTLILLSSLTLLMIELFRNKGSAILNLGVTFLGIFYIGIFLTTLIALREFYNHVGADYINGAYLVISIFASIWIGDSAAYYGGTAFGKHKLFPRVSPNKSWEGTILGFIFSVATMILAKFIILDFLSMLNVLAIGIIIGIVGQIGDFAESLLKRDSTVKDSSSLIPGHGGFFDRFDSLIFSAPVIWMYLSYFG